MKNLFLVFLVSVATVATASIELVISPEVSTSSIEILRWSLYRDKDLVKFGRCDILEAECSPDSPSLVVQRELSYQDYLKRLAERYNVPAAYLANHRAGLSNYLNYRQVLQAILEDPAVTDLEKKQAQQKFDRLTAKGGTLERFYKALAIKRELEWPRTQEEKDALAQEYATAEISAPGDAANMQVLFTYEKSMRQFEESLYAMNFAAPSKKDPNQIDEPSTGLTWVLAGASVSYAEAVAACQKISQNHKLPTQSQLQYAAPWLAQTPLVEQITAINGEKYAWTPDMIQDTRKHMGKRYQTIQVTPRYSKSGDFDYFYSTYRFSTVAIWPRYRATHVDLATTEEKILSQEDIIARHGGSTIKLAVFCVAPTSY